MGKADSTITTSSLSQFNRITMIQALSKVLSKVAVPSSSRTAVRVYLIRHGETNWNRKGKIQGGGYDVPLNENGREQAKKAAVALEGITLDAVASSSLSRAKETADIVWEEHSGGEVLRIVDDGFNEMRFGEFEGLGYRLNQDAASKEGGDGEERIQELKEQLDRYLAAKKKVVNDPDYRFPSRTDSGFVTEEDEIYRTEKDFGTGESTRMVEDRAVGALSRTIDRLLRQGGEPGSASTKHIAIVSHGRTNKILMASMLTGDAHTGYGKIGQGNANISVLDYVCDDTEDANDNESGDSVRPPSFWKGVWTARVLNYTDHLQDTSP